VEVKQTKFKGNALFAIRDIKKANSVLKDEPFLAINTRAPDDVRTLSATQLWHCHVAAISCNGGGGRVKRLPVQSATAPLMS